MELAMFGTILFAFVPLLKDDTPKVGICPPLKLLVEIILAFRFGATLVPGFVMFGNPTPDSPVLIRR